VSLPPTVTWRSCIASSSAACVLGGVRLISSARTTFAKTGPFRNRNSRSPVERSSWITSVPVMSDGMRSGVNWMRLKLRSSVTAGDPLRCSARARGPCSRRLRQPPGTAARAGDRGAVHATDPTVRPAPVARLARDDEPHQLLPVLVPVLLAGHPHRLAHVELRVPGVAVTELGTDGALDVAQELLDPLALVDPRAVEAAETGGADRRTAVAALSGAVGDAAVGVLRLVDVLHRLLDRLLGHLDAGVPAGPERLELRDRDRALVRARARLVVPAPLGALRLRREPDRTRQGVVDAPAHLQAALSAVHLGQGEHAEAVAVHRPLLPGSLEVPVPGLLLEDELHRLDEGRRVGALVEGAAAARQRERGQAGHGHGVGPAVGPGAPPAAVGPLRPGEVRDAPLERRLGLRGDAGRPGRNPLPGGAGTGREQEEHEERETGRREARKNPCHHSAAPSDRVHGVPRPPGGKVCPGGGMAVLPGPLDRLAVSHRRPPPSRLPRRCERPGRWSGRPDRGTRPDPEPGATARSGAG
jgi:hypothetical protein